MWITINNWWIACYFGKKITKFESSVKAFIHIEKHGVVDKNFKLFTKLSTKV